MKFQTAFESNSKSAFYILLSIQFVLFFVSFFLAYSAEELDNSSVLVAFANVYLEYLFLFGTLFGTIHLFMGITFFIGILVTSIVIAFLGSFCWEMIVRFVSD